ncbi:MAG: porphobilinogen synthase, partial [Ornithinibacter sp.]
MGFPTHRPRRLRRTPALRRLVAETRLHAADLVLPVFVREGIAEPVPISAMPGVLQHTMESLLQEAHRCVAAGLGGIMVFGVPQAKDARGSGADHPDGILNLALRALVEEVGDELVVMADLCLDEFTDHGHCGVLAADGSVDNDATLDRYASMALAQAATGAPVLGLSGMMDGQVASVRAALDVAGHTDTVLLAYAAKYTSGLYGPFREA